MLNNKPLARTSFKKTTLQKRNMPIRLTQKGSVLLEALIAILIFSFGILAISGLQGAMMKNTADATFRSEASYVVQQKMGELLSNPNQIGIRTETSQEFPALARLPNGSLATNALSNGRIQFVVTWNAGDGQHQYEATTSVFTAR